MNGSIPSLDTLTKLEDFIANRCNLSGDIPSLTNNTELKSLNIENNNMTGFTDSTITSKLVDIKAKNNALRYCSK